MRWSVPRQLRCQKNYLGQGDICGRAYQFIQKHRTVSKEVALSGEISYPTAFAVQFLSRGYRLSKVRTQSLTILRP